MTKDDVLFGYRQQLFAQAARTSVSAACRTFGVHRSTYYAWKRQVDRHGLEMLRPRERRRPQMPNAFPKMIEERIVSFSLAHPGLGPRRVASELAREKLGGIIVSANGVWKVLCRHGLNTRAKRLGLIAGYAAPYEPPREARARAAHRGFTAGRARRDRLLLRGTPEGHRRCDLAAQRDRHRLLLCMGGPGDLQERQPRPPSRPVGSPDASLLS
jgi:transposase